MPPVSGRGTVRFMNAPLPSRAENCGQLGKAELQLTMRFKNGCEMTPTTGRFSCMTPMEQLTLGLGMS